MSEPEEKTELTRRPSGVDLIPHHWVWELGVGVENIRNEAQAIPVHLIAFVARKALTFRPRLSA